MDEALETPNASLPATTVEPAADWEEDLDEGPADWNKLAQLRANPNRSFIPKRGEKEYEPAGGPSARASSGSGLQKHTLDSSRRAMYQALKSERRISNKTLSSAIWFPRTAHAEVIVSRGTLFSNMGYSNSRDGRHPENGARRKGKHLELLPEEALYLVERGSMYCWRSMPTTVNNVHVPVEDRNLEDVQGAPMSVQQAYAEMIGSDGELTNEKYQVYTYLKRLGYTVIRAQKPRGVEAYPVAQTKTTSTNPMTSRVSNYGLSGNIRRRIGELFSRRRDLWLPGIISQPWNLSFSTTLSHIHHILAGYSRPHALVSVKCYSPTSPYVPFYHVYKPSTTFKRSMPVTPDFQIIVINAHITPLPTLSELTTLFATQSPTLRGTAFPITHQGSLHTSTMTFFTWFKHIWEECQHIMLAAFGWPTAHVIRNPYPYLKAGTRHIVVAAVDQGGISFVRFGEGCFDTVEICGPSTMLRV